MLFLVVAVVSSRRSVGLASLERATGTTDERRRRPKLHRPQRRADQIGPGRAPLNYRRIRQRRPQFGERARGRESAIVCFAFVGGKREKRREEQRDSPLPPPASLALAKRAPPRRLPTTQSLVSPPTQTHTSPLPQTTSTPSKRESELPCSSLLSLSLSSQTLSL
jgi:hypothetical protein